MALTIVNSEDERLMSPWVLSALRGSLGRFRRVTLLAPSFSAGLDVQRQLADERDLALGVSVTTPMAWLGERWGLYGDGRTLVDGASRALIMGELLATVPGDVLGSLDRGAGTADYLANLAGSALAWLPRDEGAMAELGLVGSEVSVARILALYADRLRDHSLVETCCAARALPSALASQGCSPEAIVAVGFSSLDPATRSLLVGLAATNELAVVVRTGDGPAFDEARGLASQLEEECVASSVPVSRLEEGVGPEAPRVRELSRLQGTLFRVGEPGVALVPSEGAVRLLLPAGPIAEPEVLAEEVVRLSGLGARSIVLTSPRVRESFSALAPKLVARGIGMRARVGCSVGETTAGKAFLSFSSLVFSLEQLCATWPEGDELGSMAWWPPVGAVDFLLNGLSGVDHDVACMLDRSWRGNRRLTPMQVLRDLTNRKNLPDFTVAAVNALRKGYVGTAAHQLEMGIEARLAQEPSMQGEQPLRSALSVLHSVEGVTQVVRDLARSGPEPADSALTQESFDLICRVCSAAHVSLRVEARAGDDAPLVEAMTIGQAASLAPASVDALVLQGLTTANYPLRDADDAATAFMEKLGMACVRRDPLASSRASLAGALRCARSYVSFERVTHGASGDDAYPSVMATELAGCYGDAGESSPKEGGVLPRLVRAEGLVGENLAASGLAPVAVDAERPAPAGGIDPSLSGLIVVPRIHGHEVFSNVLSLSATQIECYLECPYKWFSLKRMGLRGLDAGCGPVEAGLFAHGVLEELHRRLIDEAEQGMGPGRVTPENLRHAISVLDEVVDERVSSKANELVAHTAAEGSQAGYIRRDLEQLLRFESTRLQGFRPVLLEQVFGLACEHSCDYAGCSFEGAIDRVDVDDAGQALVIDYKNRSRKSLYEEYRLFADEKPKEYVLPRHVQALIYAQVARRSFGLDVVGALYFGTKGAPTIMGALTDPAFDRVAAISERLRPFCTVPAPALGIESFASLLDRTEELVGKRIERLRAGDVEANPVDADACTWCPVTVCERRLP